MLRKLFCLVSFAILLCAVSSTQAAILEITPEAPVPGELDIANFVGALTDADNVGTEDDSNNSPYWNDWCTYVAHDRGGQGQTFVTGDSDVVMTGVWVKHVTYSGADPDQTWYQMQAGAELEIRVTDPAAAGTDVFVLASEIYVVTGEEENALPADATNDQTGTSLWFHITLDAPVALAANTEYGFDLTSLSGKAGAMFFETDGINDRALGGNPYEAGTAYTSGVNPDDYGDDLNGANDNNMVVAPGDHVFVVELRPDVDAELVAAFAFGSRDLECPTYNVPSVNYTMVHHADREPETVQSLQYDPNKGYGYEVIYPEDSPFGDRSGYGIFGPFDDSPNNRDAFPDKCPEELYDSFIGAKDFTYEVSEATMGDKNTPGDPPEGIIFRVDVPNGFYRFVAAVGEADNPHAHRLLAEDGGSGPPEDIGGNHVVLVHNHDQAQYDIGEVDADGPGKGVFARVGFSGLIPPPDDGVPPSPVFVDMDEYGMPTDTDADSPILWVTQGYIRIHQLQGNSNDSEFNSRDANGGDAVILELWQVPPPPQALTISSTSGGSVTTPGEGTFIYDKGTEAEVKATADEFYYFLKWTGSAVDAGKVADPRSANTTVFVDGDYSLKANFAGENFKLTVSSTDGGSVVKPGEGEIVINNTQIQLLAVADPHYEFVNWTGSAVDIDAVQDPDSPSTRIYIDRDLNVKANFVRTTRILIISSTEGGSVTTPGEGAFEYDLGTEVSVVATPDEHYHFLGWTGTAVDAGKVADPGSASTTVTVDGDYTLIANFEIDKHTLTISSNYGGSVTTPGEGVFEYDYGTVVDLVATADPNYRFKFWTGPVADTTSASTTVTITEDITVSAVFVKSRPLPPK